MIILGVDSHSLLYLFLMCSALRTKKLPPLHTGADWKVVLHLPEIEKWLRATSDRVAQLTHSVGQDSDNRHVDVHLVQLKDICEDISDHVEQIHALLETEFSLKLLSYSVNIIVDIRTVQLLWHQLRVSVLVLKERLLQGLQDPNGNYTRQTDILQAFSQDQHQTRLDALTEVDDCGQLTIRCSQDYFSLDCGITAFELSDYSPSDHPEDQGTESTVEDSSQDIIHTTNSNLELHKSLPQPSLPSDIDNHSHSTPQSPTNQSDMSKYSESSKRPLQAVSHSTESSPTQPSLPKRAALFSNKGTKSRGSFRKARQQSELQHKAELSQSSPSLVDSPDRSKFWLELDSADLRNLPQSSESLQVRANFYAFKESQVPSERIQSREHWYGSDEFLALPAQLHETEMLAVKLESLIQSRTLQNQRGLQDVDDWELSELNMDWDHPHRQTSVSCFSSSSSDVAPSLEDSIESGPLSDLLSGEEQSRRSVDGSPQLTAPLADGHGCASLMKKLLEDIQDQNEGIWVKMECFVQKLDGFISWLQEALDSTENWTQPRQDLDSLRVYLDTHLTFKLNVDSQHALKESILAEGKALLSVITSHQLALKDILHMVGSQWDQLQWQIRRQHGWMLRALRCIQTRLLYTSHSQQPCASTLDLSQVALEMMSVRLRGLHYPSSSRRYNRSSSLQEFEAEYQELWEWLMDMDAMVTDSHQLMMSEEQRHHLCKLLMMESRKTSLLRQAASLKRSGSELPSNLHIKIHNLTHTWQQLEVIPDVAAESPRSALSPMTNSLLEQLEARIKELKAWLRDTELLIFNSCLRQGTGASEQLSSFKSLCSEIGSRRRGVASVLKLCQKLLQQSQVNAEQHREALQLLSINLERRWEAIVMQALQWQNRLKRDPVSVASVIVPPEDSWEWDETDILPSNSILANDNQPVEIQTDIQATQLKELSNLKDGSSMDVNSHSPPNNNVYQVYSLHSIELCKQPVFPLTSTLMHINKPVKNKEHFLLKSISKDSSLSSIESLPDLLGGLMSSSQQRDRISEFCNRESEGGRRSGQSENSLRSDCESGIVSDNGDSETSSNSGVQGKKEDQGIERQEKRDRRKSEITQEHYSLALEKNCIAPYKKSKMQISTNLEEWRRNELRCEIKRSKEEKKRSKQGGGEAVEILINGHGILTPANSDSDIDVKGLDDSKMFMSQRDNTECNPDHYNSSETLPALNSRTSSPVLSQSSSLESLLALGINLFPSKERLHHSVSLESCLNPCHSPDRESVGSLTSPDEMNLGQDKDQDRINLRASMDTETEASSGELSQRTLDLLKRLENIQNPLVGKMTRSVSDMSIQSSIPQKNHFPVSPSLGGQHTPLSRMFSTSWKRQPSLINENLSKISLTELSSTEDSSLGSEDFVVLRNQHPLFLDPNIATSSSPRRKHCHNGNRAGKGVDESDAASLSMVVNVSCTSACTDEDEDDSDLLSSSTLTLTEEELGDEDNDEDDMETSYELGLEYMKRELQSWMRPPRTSVSSSFKSEAGLLDELQCGSAPPSTFPYSRAQLMDTSNKTGGNTSRKEREDETRLNVTRSYISQFVDDVENGNIDHSCLQGKDEDDELLQEESGLFTQKRDTLRDFYVNTKTEDQVEDVGNLRAEMDSKPVQSNKLFIFFLQVLEHSHRPLHLRKGDFYSYLSLSSHDSDCGEVSQCAEDKSLTPVPYSIPSYCTSTPTPNSPSPELFPSTKVAMSSFQSRPSGLVQESEGCNCRSLWFDVL
uniref:A kinase (PRKA) anchor protein 6 n=1 Tax=Poecilia mexicana TaxID=48701 RepID=A0A3B3XD56_9TELE